jgi:hypothetical protein
MGFARGRILRRQRSGTRHPYDYDSRRRFRGCEVAARWPGIIVRSGPAPPEIGLVLKLVRIKPLLPPRQRREARSRPNDMTLPFRHKSFANSTGLVR